MNSCDALVTAWMDHRTEKETLDIVAAITNDSISLLTIIKSLGPYLTSETGSKREAGVALLSDVLKQCPPAKINRQSTRVLVTFYSDRLDDTETVIPTLNGLLHLCSLPTFLPTDSKDLFRALVTHVNMKGQAQSTRYVVFKVLDLCFSKFRDAMKSLESECIKGYLKLAEGEKDPRNLLIAFSIVRVILIELNADEYIDDLFDITFCYFPITFKPPPNDPYGITTEDLKSALRSCLDATPLFGPLAIPLFLEKLAATTPHVKRDTLQTLEICLPVYGAEVVQRFSTTLWEALKVEILQPIDSETQDRALDATQALIRTLYGDSTGPSPDGLATEICRECIDVLKEPEKTHAQRAVKILSALIKTTGSIRGYALSNAVPHMLRLHADPDEAPHRRHILLELSGLLTAAKEVYSSQPLYEAERSLDELKDQLLDAFTSGLKILEARSAALDGLMQMVQTPGFLSREDIGFIVSQVDELLGPSSDLADNRGSVLDLVSFISKSEPKLIEETTLRSLFAALPDAAPGIHAKADRVAYQDVLKSLTTLCSQPNLFESLVVRLFTKLELICSAVLQKHQADSPEDSNALIECNAAYAHAILVTIDNILHVKLEQNHTDLPKYTERIMSRLFALAVVAADQPESRTAIAADVRLLRVSASILESLIRSSTVERQAQVVTNLMSSYRSNDFSVITHERMSMSSTNPAGPLDPAASLPQRNLILLLAGPLIAVRREVQIPVPDLSQFLQELADWTMNTASNDVQSQAGMQIVASLLNKHSGSVASFINIGFESLWMTISAETSPQERRLRGVEIWQWMARALLISKHQTAEEKVDKLFELLDDPSIAWDAAKAIGGLVKDDKVLTKQNYAVVKVLYTQKYADRVLERILREYPNTKSPHARTAYLVALAALVTAVPQQMYGERMTKMMPLFILGLSIPDVGIRTNVIDTLFAVAKDDTSQRDALVEHASTLVTTLLQNALPCEVSSTKLRVAALRCLGVLPNAIPYDVLHPHKAGVLRQLAKVLDDPKREVRRMAVDTRSVWFAFNG